MFFTQEDYKKIEAYLQRNSVKDTELPVSLPLVGNEIISLVQNGNNVKTTLVNFLSSFRTSNFINVSETGSSIDDKYTLEEALAEIKPSSRVGGCIITFISKDTNNWEVYQYLGLDEKDWYDTEYWRNILEKTENHFKGFFESEDALYNKVKAPEVGNYAYVGTSLGEAVIYKCRTRFVWSKTLDKASEYLTILIQGSITIGPNGNWFQDGEDTGISAQGPAGNNAPKITSITLNTGESGNIVSGTCYFDDDTSIPIIIN